KEDLIRAGGDPGDRIQQMVQEHEAASHNSDATKVNVSSLPESRGLVQQFQQWWALHQKQLQLWQAKLDATSAQQTLSAKHNSLDKQVDSQGANATTAAAENGSAAPSQQEQSATILKTTKRRAADSKTLSTLDKRVENEKALATIYSQWIAVVA